MAEVRFKGVQKKFRDALVVRDLHLTIQDKEFFTFVGPSGCGKSTILNMIAGLESVSGGTILFDGARVNELPPGSRDVAMVFQSYALYPHMTVYENMAFPLKIKKEPRETIESEIHRVSSLLGLQPFLHRKPRELSGGQRQRVALGRAIIRKPRVFLMDEPLSNLDARLRIEMRAELRRLHREFPITTAYVTHDQEEAMALSDRMAVLEKGEVQQCGPPLEIYSNPANLFVAEFIGSPPMNLLPGARLKKIGSFSHRFRACGDRDVLVGLRPSDVAVSADPEEGALEGEVAFVEHTGNDQWVDGFWQGTRIKGRAKPDEKIPAGAKAFFKVCPEHLHLFDRSTGERLRS